MSVRAGRELIDRVIWAALALLALAILATARSLTPHPSGLGTHLELGLPPCGFLLALGLPCPTCGLTTAFAHLARFELLEAVRANPMGVPLFALTLIVVPLSLCKAWRGASFRGQLVARLAVDRLALWLALALLATWAVRVAVLLTR